MLVEKPNILIRAWNNFMCLQGRHKVSMEDRKELADYPKDRFQSICVYCDKNLILRRDPFSPREFLIEED